eukprot:1160698-Pelagomonas_calceolata.AAC.9
METQGGTGNRRGSNLAAAAAQLHGKQTNCMQSRSGSRYRAAPFCRCSSAVSQDPRPDCARRRLK